MEHDSGKLRRFLATKRKAALGVVFGIVTVVVMGIVLILGALVFFAFGNSLPTGLVTGAQQSTLTSIINTGSAALSLLEVILIVAAAGLIIAAVFAYMALGRRTPKPIKALAEAALNGDWKTVAKLVAPIYNISLN